MVLDMDDDERLNIFDIDASAGIYGLSEYAVEIFEHLRESEVLANKDMCLIDLQVFLSSPS